ncbi:MEDS domain-containing protein [Lentzea aerocolonigenes]|uniref:MEDS domain-containing protein n=1 Tax=Lentzea aerocolonigenes TaxID=68170 RepID=UPI000A4F4BFA|nr:MEDS domain-containing protein [Lentzea aerocolonigenes]MCP2250472.1 MEDS: MEthanogen/methylotroph, DcmR Sensory domain [Lentzea aerocolonigenes]
MITLRTSAHPAFLHQGCFYGSDAEFLAMAVPFVLGGLRSDEPVLVATTPANLELLHAEIGQEAEVDYVEREHLGLRPPQRATAIHRYWSRHHSPATSRAVRVLSEPEWTDRPAREVSAWQRMEAALNVVLADTQIWMICPYDTRTTSPHIVDDARRTHPECVVGHRVEPSSLFMRPEEFARSHVEPMPPAAAEGLFRFEGDLTAVRRYALRAAARLLRSDDAAAGMFGIAVGEAVEYLDSQGVERAAVWLRPAAGRIVCTLHSDEPLACVPTFLGYRPPDVVREPGDGLWLTNQICEWLDVTSDASGCTIELAMPGDSGGEMKRAERQRLAFGA